MYKSTCIIRLTNSTEMHDGRLQCWSLTHTYRQRDRPNCEAAFSLFTRHVCTYNVQQSALSSTWHFLLVFVRPSLSLFSLWVYFTNCRHKLLTVVYRLHTTHWLGADLIIHTHTGDFMLSLIQTCKTWWFTSSCTYHLITVSLSSLSHHLFNPSICHYNLKKPICVTQILSQSPGSFGTAFTESRNLDLGCILGFLF